MLHQAVGDRAGQPGDLRRQSNNPPGRRLRVFQDDRVRFHGQPVAVMVATTLEAAQHGASLVKVGYDAEQPSTDLTEAEPDEPTRYARGDAEGALRSAAAHRPVLVLP